MNINHSELVKILAANSDWQTAKSLALKLNVSERSIKTYVSAINGIIDQAVLSSKKGYRFRDQDVLASLLKQISQRPWSPDERIRNIMLDILNSCIEEEGVDIDILSEDYNVSAETIRRDLAVVKEYIEKLDLKLTMQGNSFRISGEEIDKRKYFADLVYQQIGKSTLRADKLQLIFPCTNISRLKEQLVETYRKNQCHMNEYALMGLVLYIVIGMERIKGNAILSDRETPREFSKNRNWPLAEELIDSLEREFQIQYQLHEREELSAMILSHITGYDDGRQLEEPDDSGVETLSASIMDYLETYFNLENLVKDREFADKFKGHLKNLLVRLRNGFIAQSPLAESIKSASPLTFECAIGIANIIEQYTRSTVHMTEVAYLALHIGDALETCLIQKGKINCTILLPQYYNISMKIVERIKLLFGEYISITAVFTSTEEILGIQSNELIISTVPLDFISKDHVAQISPLLTERDKDLISEKIQKIRSMNSLQKLQQKLHQVLNPAFFARNIQFSSSADAIRYMCGILIQEGMAWDDFAERVIERETQASTAFGRLAVPHAMKMQSKKTGIFVLINEKPIPWGDHNVNVVLLFCIRDEDRMLFYDIFDNVISSFVEDRYIDEILSCKNYQEFENLMLGYLNFA